MSQENLSLSTAAKLMGMSRKVLQHKIQTGEIESFEGKINLELLKKSCPTAKVMNTSTILERMQFIKDNAYASRMKTAHIPEAHILLSQIKKLRLELKLQQQHNLRYLSVISELRSRLQESQLNQEEGSLESTNQLLAIISTQLSRPLSKKSLI